MNFLLAFQTLHRWLLVVVCSIFLTPGFLSAQIPNVKVQSLEGETLTGSLTSISAEGDLEGLNKPINLTSVLSLTTNREQTPSDDPIRVHLISGGFLGANSIQIENEKASLRGRGQQVDLPLEAVRAVVWKKTPIVEKALANPSKDNDQVLVTIKGNQGSVEGLLEGISKDGVQIFYEGKSRRISLEKVDGVVIADLQIPAAKGAQATVETIDGAKLIGVIKEMNSLGISVGLTAQAAIKVRCNQIYSFKIASDRLQYLSDLEPVEAREDTVFAVERSFKKDTSVAGQKMTLLDVNGAPVSIARGIGVQSTSELTFLNAGFDRFRAIVGIDLETKGRGDCEAIVRGDGIELWRKRIQGGQKAEEVDIDISGINKVTLIVNPGREFDLADHLDWGNARFLKTKQ